MKNKSGVDADANQLKCTMATGIVMDSQTSKLRSSAKTAPGENAKTIKARRSDGFYRRYIDKIIKVRDSIYLVEFALLQVEVQKLTSPKIPSEP